MADHSNQHDGIPSGWCRAQLSDLCDSERPIVYGIVQAGPDIDGGVPYIRSTDLTHGLDERRLMRTSKEIAHKYRRSTLMGGDLVLSLRGNIGSVLPLPSSLGGANLTQGTARIAVRAPNEASFIKHAIEGRQAQAWFNAVAKGSALREISLNDLRHLKLLVPIPAEQRAIGQLLDTWDVALEVTSRLSRLRRKLKRGLLQKLLSGRCRYPEFRKQPWVERRIGEVLQETFRPVQWNDNAEYRLASVRRGSKGLFDRGCLFGRQIKVKKLNTIRRDDFLISHIQAAYGAMGLVPREFDGASVSDMYSVLTSKAAGSIDMRFVNYLSQRKEFRHMAYLSSNGFFAERLRLNFDPRDFMHRKLLLPPTVAEQSKIADTLQTLDREIDGLQRLHDALKEQKKGLMQKLLTGQVRVPASMLKEAAHA